MIEIEADLSQEFKMQEELDQYIIQKRGLNLSILKDERILAVFDEVCELMNKMRFHKYWSNKAPEAKEDLLEEYVDTWHFILSNGNSIGVVQVHCGIDIRATYTKQFRAILFTANDIHTPIGWTLFVSLWKGLGHMMGFSPDEVRTAYKRKYQINVERQNNDY
jgi:dimeric dUTPase (all-alpha-NTP-PPase superfamily)